MLFALALMAQDVTLNADATQAIGCGRAVIAASPSRSENAVTPMLQAVYFMMIAAQADPGKDGKRFLERTSDVAPSIFQKGGAQTPLAACDKRYPMARSTAQVKLPANAFDRDMMCAAASSYAFGILSGAGIGDKVKDYERVQQGFVARIPDDVLKAHGISTEDTIIGAMDNALRGTLRVGNLEMIMQACTRELDGK